MTPSEAGGRALYLVNHPHSDPSIWSALDGTTHEYWKGMWKKVLEAMGVLAVDDVTAVKAQALEEAVDAFPLETITEPDNAVTWLMDRARRLREGAGPVRVQRKREKGWRMPENTVYVGRPGKWGNPYRVNGDASEAVRLFRDMLRRAPLDNHGHSIYSTIRTTLVGKNLACFCPLDQPCHADVLLELANAP